MAVCFFLIKNHPRVGWLPAACVYIYKYKNPQITKITKITKSELCNLYK